jgi:hypothetical protein
LICGPNTSVDLAYAFVSRSACTFVATTDADCAATAGGNDILFWKDATGGGGLAANQADDTGNTATCSLINAKNPMDSGTAITLGTDGHWDPDAVANYKVKELHVAHRATNGGPANVLPPATAQGGFGAFFQGEAFSASAKAACTASSGGITGTKTSVAPSFFCSPMARGEIADPAVADNKGSALINTANEGWRCDAGALVNTATDGFMNHNTVGATAADKNCWSLPFEGAATKAKCDANQTCDRFNEAASCVTTTNIMSKYTAATATKKHCMRWPSAAADDKYRVTSTPVDYASKECAVGEFCNNNSGSNSDKTCLKSVIGTSAKNAARQDGALDTQTTPALKWCVGETIGAHQCLATSKCNPHSATIADLCINKSATGGVDQVAAHGELGAATPTGTDTRKYCIGDNAAGARCSELQVCNYAGGAQSDSSSTAGGAVCLNHADLLGTGTEILTTAAWTAAAQRKMAGATGKYCLSTDAEAVTFASKVCLATETCNPHTGTPSDVCKTTTTVLAHGELAPLADATDATLSKVACIATGAWKACNSETAAGVKEVCNEGATVKADVCLLATTLVNEEFPLEAYWEAGTDVTADQKWCMSTNGASKCTIDTICNPSSAGGSGSDAICPLAETSVAHNAAPDDTAIYCLGKRGNAALASDAEAGDYLCDQGSGTFILAESVLDPRAKNETPDDLGDDDVAVENCFGVDDVETCDVGTYCNSLGTTKGCKDGDEDCTIDNICFSLESAIEEGEKFVVDGKSICLNADATAGEQCTETKMYCDQSLGECSEQEVAPTSAPGGTDGGEGEAASGCAAQSIAAAAVVAILSA